MSDQLSQIINKLKSNANPKNIEGMARFGINYKNTLGVSMPIVRKMAKQIGKNHSLAIKLWNTKIHEARILASLVAEPLKFTEKQAEKWVSEFDSWDVCDQCCLNLLHKTRYAFEKAVSWSKRNEEFVKRAGFALMAVLAVHAKVVKDNDFCDFFDCILNQSTDERNFVKKAVNWALRQIGKRNSTLKKKSLNVAQKILELNSKTARWIATDAIKELKNKTFK